jgi:CIC family chloride channel protein
MRLRTLWSGRESTGSTPRLPLLPAPGDFTADRRLIGISALAAVTGAVAAVMAVALLRLIGLFTNLFYYQRLSLALVSPARSPLGPFAVAVPVIGGLLIGLMARYGSERIRGHGIPEAMEAILIGRSRMKPREAVLKPISSAVAIGSGGPFGAEGPIIMTGGAFGSLIAQAFQLSASERKTLLVAGAAAGMSATFGTPFAAVLLAVELLLFEWKPRSLVPVALAAALAAIVRPWLLGHGPLFPVPPHPALPASLYPFAILVGLATGLLSVALTVAVYAAEDAFRKLPIHWMWWPAIGGLVVGVGGLFEPRALGVGYDVIDDLLTGKYVPAALLGLVLVKAAIWSIALGSGSSGGVLAPLLMMGGSLGALVAHWSPGGDRTLWPLVAMSAALGGTMRSPLTAVAFALELTHDINTVPALLVAAIVADGLTVLMLKRSILTEKVARRGYHLSREYSVDPLEALHVAEVMTKEVISIPASLPVEELEKTRLSTGHQGYPVLDDHGAVIGVVTRTNLLSGSAESQMGLTVSDLVDRPPIVVHSGETCRTAAERMAEAGVGRLPVVSDDGQQRLVGIVTRSDLLKPRARRVEEELVRERFFGRRATSATPAPPPRGRPAGPKE